MQKELAQINRKIERDEHAEELKRIEKATRALNICTGLFCIQASFLVSDFRSKKFTFLNNDIHFEPELNGVKRV